MAQKLALSGFSAVEASVLRDIGGLAILLTMWWWQEGALAKLTKADLRMLGLLGLARASGWVAAEHLRSVHAG